MKKLGILFILSVVFVNIYSQRIYSDKEYTKKTNHVINITFNPLKTGIGCFFVSKPIFEFTSLISSIEIGEYKEANTKVMKLGLGTSFIIKKNVRLNTSLCYNLLTKDNEDVKPISLEIGAMLKVEKLYFSITIDPINYEPKIGIGFNL